MMGVVGHGSRRGAREGEAWQINPLARDKNLGEKNRRGPEEGLA